ncbi:E3 ubiquitin-protein ligase hrd1 [Puttea exsequens]|nr:E3 ubiquitin-protein ligase hrd1 [Puttea exsequens]
MLGLQRLFYGQLRPIETEQLWEKAWFALTETCLAMTIFREEVGGWFLVMFVSLLIGKVWGWIGEGRVEILEQQPPTNPRLFHARLSGSLIVASLFDILMLKYSVKTVLRHARPNMMVMFAFEFAVLTITSLSTATRYGISLYEAKVTSHQIEDRRAQLKRERQAEREREAGPEQNGATQSPVNDMGADDDIDSLDVDVPGWEEKGRWVFYLDLATGEFRPFNKLMRILMDVLDFSKLILYLAFFFVLCMFYGMPIHIIRDVALTIRSFYKRITDFVRYRQATRDMNERYPDASPEEVAREDVCIICREEMRPWQAQNTTGTQQPQEVEAARPTTSPVDERLRPKKLPCGHILHFACLRSWLERQQNCPTCRRPVLVNGTVARVQGQNMADQHGRAQAQNNQPRAHGPVQPNFQQPVVAQNVFTLGPLRIAFGARRGIQGPQQNNQTANPANQQAAIPTGAQTPRISNDSGSQREGAQPRTTASFSPNHTQLQLAQIEQHLAHEISGLRLQQHQLSLLRALQAELARLRTAQANPDINQNGLPNSSNPSAAFGAQAQISQIDSVHSANPQQQSLGPGHAGLPPGITLPQGWSVLPLQRLPDSTSINSMVMNQLNQRGVHTQGADTVPISSAPSSSPPESNTANPRHGAATATGSSASSHFAAGPSSSVSSHEQHPNTSSQVPEDPQGKSTAASSKGIVNEPVGSQRSQFQSDGAAISPASQEPPDIPRWGSALEGLAPNSRLESVNGTGSRDAAEGSEAGTPLTSQEKGKGKAPTVEEAVDDGT